MAGSELQQYFLHRKNRDRWSPNTMRICYCGIRFLFLHVLKRDWHTLDLVRAQSERRLLAVLSLEDVRAILGSVRRELAAHGFTVTEIELPPWPQPICQACGGRLHFHSAVREQHQTGSGLAIRHNHQHSTMGHLFQGRYEGILVERDAYLLELSRYVVLNPVRAGLVAEAGDWPWSSYGSMVASTSIRTGWKRV